MNQFEQEITRLEKVKKEKNIFWLLKEIHSINKIHFNRIKSYIKDYKLQRKSINSAINALKKILKVVDNDKVKENFNKFVEESYKNFVNSIEYYNNELNILSNVQLKEKIKSTLDSKEYKELIEYFEKESTFEIYKKICERTGYGDCFNLVKINTEQIVSVEESTFISKVAEFINLINKHLPNNLPYTEEEKMKYITKYADIQVLKNNDGE